ncbi:MAG: hypothetical protein F4X66_06760 [Chloroflexi bacterium]|nr:hypothetical protein [Chloroflexota bacterium]MYE41807.1 hypothetical protein [Chloroflexota bacterium]
MEIHGNKPVLEALTRQYNQLGQEIKEKMELQAALGLVRTYFENLERSRTHTEAFTRLEHPETGLSGLYVDFHGARNLLERIVRIGEAAEGKLLNSTKVARFLIDSEVSRGKVTTLRREVGQTLKLHPELFEPISTGNYRFLGRYATVPIPPLGAELLKGMEDHGLPRRTGSGPIEGLNDSEELADLSTSAEREMRHDYDE